MTDGTFRYCALRTMEPMPETVVTTLVRSISVLAVVLSLLRYVVN